MTARYAIYYAPPEGSTLDLFGRRWFGRDAAGGTVRDRLALSGIDDRRLEALIRMPRLYGFHATLKPPFRLAARPTAEDLGAAVFAFARRRRSVVVPALVPAVIGRFIALVPSAAAKDLDTLAAECVARFDRFRAPPTADELSRRRASRLSERQEALLARWGYAYVFEEFRFHMTLTDGIDGADERAAMLAALAPVVAPLARTSLVITELCLFRQDRPGRSFVINRRFALGPSRPGGAGSGG